jgi:hypothetical protein
MEMVKIFLCKNEKHAPYEKWFLDLKIEEKNGAPVFVCPYCGNDDLEKMKIADVSEERAKEILNSHDPIWPQPRWKDLKDVI